MYAAYGTQKLQISSNWEDRLVKIWYIYYLNSLRPCDILISKCDQELNLLSALIFSDYLLSSYSLDEADAICCRSEHDLLAFLL